MHIRFHRSFKKSYIKLPKAVQAAFDERLELLVHDMKHPLLHVHALKGSMYPLQSMNVNGDYRALFIVAAKTVTFYEIGTHSELYG